MSCHNEGEMQPNRTKNTEAVYRGSVANLQYLPEVTVGCHISEACGDMLSAIPGFRLFGCLEN